MQGVGATVKEVVFAILPVTCMVLVLQFTIIGLPTESVLQFMVGVAFVSVGLVFFLLGVHVGLLPVGEKIGAALPRTGKVWLVLALSFVLGFAITVAEPDVRVLASYVDEVSDGAIPRFILIYTVALGLGLFVTLAMARIILNVPIKWLIAGGYGLIFLLLALPQTPAEFVPISFDAGGVTTGPMAVPFIIAFGLGVAAVLGGRTRSEDGFGLVALASIGPVLAMIILGMIYG
ncbi:hypothetical protein BH23BAC4_BH23BAC4_04370 [soil metagenome]